MATQSRLPRTEYTNPATWNAYSAFNFQWIATHLRDYPDSSASRITGTTTANFYSDHFGGTGSEFSIPADATVNAVRVQIYMKKNSAASCSVAGSLYVGGNFRYATAQALAETAALHTFTWAVNPVTGAAWTPAQINDHTNTNGIALFGFAATDVAATFDVFSFQLEVDYTPVVVAPTIDAQPTAQTVTAPAAATFIASVGGTFTGLRWQRQAAGAGAWADVPGATSASFTTGATTVSGGSWNNTDRVRLAVDWSGGTVLSADVALTVAAGGSAPSITTQPANASVTTPATVTFTVSATGSGTLTYQWQRQPAAGGGYVNISGATSASYTTPATSVTGGSANNGDTYRCIVTGDTAPPATSTAATLTVLAPLATTFTFAVNGAVSLTGLKYAIFEEVTPDQWVAPIKKGADETTDASGVCTVSVAGLTARRVGELGSAFVTNSDGTATGGAQAATRRATYYVGAFS